MPPTSLAGTTALLMGASAGIGAALAEALAARGANLAIAARRAAPLAALAAKLGPNVLPLTCDVSDNAQVEAAVAATAARFGRIDHLINNAGVIEPIGHLHETDPAEWARCISINLAGPYHACRAALPHLLKQGGTIVNVSSGAGHRPLEGWSAYCASKAGLVMLTRSLMLEYGERGIRAYGFSPGTVRTEMQTKIRATGMNPVSQLPIEALIPAAAPAEAIAWLCTAEAADYPQGEIALRDDELRRRAGVHVDYAV